MSDHDRAENWRIALTVLVGLTAALIYSEQVSAAVPDAQFCEMLRAWGWEWWQLILVGCW
jgi:hypothetical protein